MIYFDQYQLIYIFGVATCFCTDGKNYLLIPILNKISEVDSWFLNAVILSKWLTDPNCFFLGFAPLAVVYDESCDPNSPNNTETTPIIKNRTILSDSRL